MCYRAGRIGPAVPVLAGPVFSQGKNKIPFLQKASNMQSASVILGLVRLIKTSGSESRGQEEAACIRVFRPMRSLQ